MSRGNGSETLFRTGEDRRRFLGLAAELARRFGTEVHAFMLMDNHFHLLVRCLGAEMSETLKWRFCVSIGGVCGGCTRTRKPRRGD